MRFEHFGERQSLIDLMLTELAPTPMVSLISCFILAYLNTLRRKDIIYASTKEISDAIGRSPKWTGRVLRYLDDNGYVSNNEAIFTGGRMILVGRWGVTCKGTNWIESKGYLFVGGEIYSVFKRAVH